MVSVRLGKLKVSKNYYVYLWLDLEKAYLFFKINRTNENFNFFSQEYIKLATTINKFFKDVKIREYPTYIVTILCKIRKVEDLKKAIRILKKEKLLDVDDKIVDVAIKELITKNL